MASQQLPPLQRREFLKHATASAGIASLATGTLATGTLATGTLATGTLAAATAAANEEQATPGLENQPAKHAFHLKYAPHFGMFRHHAGDDPLDQLQFAADQGFTAWEDNGMKAKPPELQEKIARQMERLGIEMGVFVAAFARGTTFVGDDQEAHEKLLAELRDSVEVAKRVNAKWMTVVPGNYDPQVEWGFQTANCIDLLRRCADIFEPHGLVMVLEPLNWWTNHAGVFLAKIPQAYEICRGVDSPACKILFDIYHQQIQEGNLIPNIDRAYGEIAYFQCGDNPGRKEPGTGEINYRNVFQHIHGKGFSGIVGMEHGLSQGGKQGEQALIDAYVAADDFA
jgi:hydroxypyruvate isomerase